MLRSSVIILCLCSTAAAADWPQWRGPNRDGISQETGLLQGWPRGGPKQVWKAQGLGEGYSSAAVVGNRLYTQGQQGGRQFVIALDVATGKQVWKTPTGNRLDNDRGNGPRGTPTVDGKRLYAIASDGTLACLETETGKPVWSVNFPQAFGGRAPNWAYSESPLVEGGNVIVVPGGRGASIVALNKDTGAVVWRTQSDRAGYSSAVPFDAGGVRGLAVLTGEAAVGLNAKNGELLWRYTKVANRTANIATPIVSRGHVFFSTDYGTGCALLKLTPEGGSVKADEVYFNSDMRNHYTTSVLIGNTLYGFSSAILTAMDFMTGQVKWRDRSVGKGNCIYADQRLYCMGQDGTAGLIEPSPEAYKEVSRFDIPKGDYPTWVPPVVANGRLYLREQDNLYSFDIKR
ncbi:MAG: PQQ-binding-like beta-propeller repeat protein [Bryobacteraceae bacterium]